MMHGPINIKFLIISLVLTRMLNVSGFGTLGFIELFVVTRILLILLLLLLLQLINTDGYSM